MLDEPVMEHIPVTQTLARQKQEEPEFVAILG